MRLAMVLGDGYSKRARTVREAIRQEVFQRAGGACEQCGGTVDLDGSTSDIDAIATIQHVAGNSNDLSNLKAFCRRCNMADAQSKMVPVNPDSDEARLANMLRLRSNSPTPMRICDDHEEWKSTWQWLTKEVRKVIQMRLDASVEILPASPAR